ncbi:hypothetical protein ACX12M_02955 [Cellulosimicrobium cellulans]
MTALVALEREYAFGTLAAAARLEHADPDEHDVEPDAPEPGGDPGPMPTHTDHEETDVSVRITEAIGFDAEVSEPNGPAVHGYFTARWADARQPDFDRWLAERDAQVRADERERIAKAIEDLPTTWPNGVKHSAAWMRLESADVARQGADA